jgi:hypothetical protein
MEFHSLISFQDTENLKIFFAEMKFIPSVQPPNAQLPVQY